MRELETKEGVYSLEGWLHRRESSFENGVPHIDSPGVFHAEARYHDYSGVPVAADTSMIEKPLDISRMTIEWVHSTEDPLFKDLSRNDRFILHLKYGRDMEISEIADSTGMESRQVKQRLRLVLESIRNSVKTGEFISPEEVN
jgi:DNA-directed RNA polymerase specialized sigma24 family protein